MTVKLATGESTILHHTRQRQDAPRAEVRPTRTSRLPPEALSSFFSFIFCNIHSLLVPVPRTQGEQHSSAQCTAARRQQRSNMEGKVEVQGNGSQQSGAEECSVCYETFSEAAPRAVLPCCTREGSSMAICRLCMRMICGTAPGGFGRCPTCRASLRIVGDTFERGQPTGECRTCRQQRILLQNETRDACLLGMEYQLSYECERCHGIQRISHPMWRCGPVIFVLYFFIRFLTCRKLLI